MARIRLILHIPQRDSPISHNAPFCSRNVHICAHFCYKIVHCGIFVWCIVGIVRWVYHVHCLCVFVHCWDWYRPVTYIYQGYFTGLGEILRSLQCHWINPAEDGLIGNMCVPPRDEWYNHTKTKHTTTMYLYRWLSIKTVVPPVP